MILRTTLPAAPNSYKTYLLKTLLKYDLFCQLGPSTSLREFVFMCTCVCVCVCVCVCMFFYCNGEDGREW